MRPERIGAVEADHAELCGRFPGNRGDWARFDGPAGTQMVDVAIDAMAAFARSGSTANSHGAFAASRECDELVQRARRAVATLYGATQDGVWFGANMTTMTFAFTRALARDWRDGDRVVGTRLDHDGNVSTWRQAATDAGAEHVLAPMNAATGRLDPQSVIDRIDERTRWVAIAGASNLLGTIPDVRAVADAAHAVGARVFVDAVAFAPHRRIDVTELGADVLVSSAYKWYGPHLGAMWVRPDLLETLRPYKVRPAENVGPSRFETGTPNYACLAALEAAANFLLDVGMESIRAIEERTFAPLLAGLHSIAGVRCIGPSDLVDRTPTVSFTVDGVHPDTVAAALADDQIAVWSGNSYAAEVGDSLGVNESGGVVRAGVVAYVDDDDVQRLLTAVERVATRGAS
jgi:cysteine desulfurase family protein (TIGR01976 family)